MKRKDVLKDVVNYIFKTMGKDGSSVKKWRIKILSICLSAILLVSIIITTVCVTVLQKENVIFMQLKLPEERTVEEYNAEIYKNELEIKRLAGKQYFAIKLSLENAEQLKQQAQRMKENAEQLNQQAQELLEKSENNKNSALNDLEKAEKSREDTEKLKQQLLEIQRESEEFKKTAEQLKQQALKAQQAAEKAQKQAQQAEKRAQLAREEADRKLKEANDIRIEKLEIQNMISKKMVKLSNTSIVDEKNISPTEIKQNIENDYTVSDQIKAKSKKVANFLTENNISYEKISNYKKTQSQKDLLMKIKKQTDGKIDQIENWNAQTQEEKEAKAYYMSKHLDVNILREKFPNMIGRASDADKLTDENVGEFDYEHRYNSWFSRWRWNSKDDEKPYAYSSISSYSSSSLQRCGFDNNYIAIGKKMSDLKLMIGDWPWIDDTINVFMNNCEVLEYVTLNKIQHEAQSLNESDIEFLIRKEINTSVFKDFFNWLIDEKIMNDIIKDISKIKTKINIERLLNIIIKAGGNKLIKSKMSKSIITRISEYAKTSVKSLMESGIYLLTDIVTDITSIFCSNLYANFELSKIENSSKSVLNRLNSTFDIKVSSEEIRSLIKLSGATILSLISVVPSFLPILLMFSVVNMIKQSLLIAKMTYTIKPTLDTFIDLLRSNPDQYNRSMYEKTKNWKTGIWYLIKTNQMKKIQDIDMEPRYQLEYLKDTSDISEAEKAKAKQEGKSQLRSCKWYEKLAKWIGLLNCQ